MRVRFLRRIILAESLFRWSDVRKHWILSLSCFLLLALTNAIAQGKFHHYIPPAPPPSLQSGGIYGGQTVQQQRQDPAEIEAQHKMATQANKDRQASLKKDTDQLYKLANELKTSVDKSSEYTLSLEVIRKAEEIEKLAKNVKDKMKASGYQPETGDSGGR